MPAFMFEKIEPPPAPVSRSAVTSITRKQRGVIIDILDRFVEARFKRTLLEEKAVMTRRKPPD